MVEADLTEVTMLAASGARLAGWAFQRVLNSSDLFFTAIRSVDFSGVVCMMSFLVSAMKS